MIRPFLFIDKQKRKLSIHELVAHPTYLATPNKGHPTYLATPNKCHPTYLATPNKGHPTYLVR